MDIYNGERKDIVIVHTDQMQIFYGTCEMKHLEDICIKSY